MVDWAGHKQPVVWVEHDCDQLGQELFPETTSILTILNAAKFIDKHNMDPAPQIGNLAEFLVAILKDVLALDLHSGSLDGSLVLICRDLALEEDRTHVERNALGHVADDVHHLFREVVLLLYVFPVVFIDIKHTRV